MADHLKTLKSQHVTANGKEWHVKPLSSDLRLGLDCLCDLVTQEPHNGHLHQACQAVLGLLSLPLSQGCCRNMILLFVQGGLEILLRQ